MQPAPDFIQEIGRIARLDAAAQQAVATELAASTYPKGTVLVPEHGLCQQLYFLKRGVVKLCFTTAEGKEIILRFFTEGHLFTSLKSFLTGRPSRFTIMALEDVAAETLVKSRLEVLCSLHPRLETFYRHVLSLATVNLMGRISELLQDDARTRYSRFVAQHPALLQRIRLSELAAYLGITPESLSRN